MTTDDDELFILPGSRVVAFPEHAAEALLSVIEAACESRTDFVEKVESALHASLVFLAADPSSARLLTVEPYAAGGDAVRRHQYWLQRYGALLRAASGCEPKVPAHPDFVEPMIVAGIGWQISRRVLTPRVEELEQLLPDLLEFILVFYLDPIEVRRVVNEIRPS
jgi:hypothetical protein